MVIVTSRRGTASLVLALAGLIGAGCTHSPGSTADDRRASAVGAAPVASPSEIPVLLSLDGQADAYDPRTAPFFSAIAFAGSEAEHYTGLTEMADAADAVVLARVKGFGLTRSLGESDEDSVDFIGVTLIVDASLGRPLPDEHASEMVVEFMGDQGTRDFLEGTVPTDASVVMFLRRKAEPEEIEGAVSADQRAFLEDESRYYRLVSSQGLYVQGDGEVVNPIWEALHGAPEAPRRAPETEVSHQEVRDPVVEAARIFASLGSFAQHVRSTGQTR